MKKKVIQYFTREYLERCKRMSPDQIIEYLEHYRTLVSGKAEQNRDAIP